MAVEYNLNRNYAIEKCESTLSFCISSVMQLKGFNCKIWIETSRSFFRNLLVEAFVSLCGLFQQLPGMTEKPEKIEYEQDEGGQQVLHEHYRFKVGWGQYPLRIDKFLMNKIANVSRSRIQEGLKSGQVLVNGKAVKSNFKVKAGHEVSVVMPRPPRDKELLPEAIPLDIVYEDNYIMVINKPPGMVVHPGYNNYTGTLVNALLNYFQGLPESVNGHDRPGIVHRIDKETSGLMVISKHKKAMNDLFHQFAEKTVYRHYMALVWGDVKQEAGKIDGNLARSLKDRKLMQVYEDEETGKPAVTHYQVIARFGYVTLLQCRLETGRTHQIRAHMRYLGHPIFNDKMYGGDKIVAGPSASKYRQFVDNCFEACPRQALHAQSLGFAHPKGWVDLFFEQPLPEDMHQLVDKWRRFAHHKGLGDLNYLLFY